MQEASKLELVRNSALASELTGDQCRVLADAMQVHDLADGEILVKQGASDNLHVLTKGDLAGELGFMDGRPRYAAIRALGETRVLSLEREKLESLLDRDPVIVYRVMRAIFRVVHVILNRLAMQSSELTNYVFKVHGKY